MVFNRHIVLFAVSLFWVVSASQCVAANTGEPDAHRGPRDIPAQINAARAAVSGIQAPAVVYVGEAHDQLSYHLNQLAVIAALHETGSPVAIGLEMIQTPFQNALDEFIGGSIDFATMLERTEYFSRWRYDARLYQPIFEYALDHELPLIALNASSELTTRISAVGLSGLTEEERRALPETFSPMDAEYRTRLEQVYEEHKDTTDSSLDRFIEVQRSWDETMGQQAATFVANHQDHILVVLAGIQHVAHGFGIPGRVEYETGRKGTIVLSENERKAQPGSADVFLDLPDESLPASGRMGVYIRPAHVGAIVDDLVKNSPAEKAGIEKEDKIVTINNRTVDRYEDIKIALWDKMPGDPIVVEILRDDSLHNLWFELH